MMLDFRIASINFSGRVRITIYSIVTHLLVTSTKLFFRDSQATLFEDAPSIDADLEQNAGQGASITLFERS